MKLLKYSAIILFGLIAFSGLAAAGGATSNSANIGEEIVKFESAVNSGQIISDGMIEVNENPNAKPNAIGEGAAEVGVKVSSGFASIMEMVSDFITAILG